MDNDTDGYGAVYFILGSIIKVGYAKFDLNLADRLEGFLGIGNLWLTPYKQAATAAFYREVSDTECKLYEQEWADYTNQFYEEV